MRLLKALGLCLLAGVGCSGEPSETERCTGTKCDSPDSTELMTCAVTDVFGMEGVLDRAYNYDLGGFSRTDPEAAKVAVQQTDDGLTLRLGHLLASDATELEPLTEDDGLHVDATQRRWQGTDDDGTRWRLLAFEDNGVGLLMRHNPDTDRFNQIANLDCNPNNTPPSLLAAAAPAGCEGTSLDSDGVCRRSNGQFASSSCCVAGAAAVQLTATADQLDCTVMWYDDSSSLDSTLGDVYDYDRGGESMTEDGHEDVDLRVSPEFSDRDDGLIFGLGGINFGMHEPDGIEFSTDAPTDVEVADTGFARYFVRHQEDEEDDVREIRIFTASGTGIVMEQGSDEPVAQLDCRATYKSPEPFF